MNILILQSFIKKYGHNNIDKSFKQLREYKKSYKTEKEPGQAPIQVNNKIKYI